MQILMHYPYIIFLLFQPCSTLIFSPCRTLMTSIKGVHLLNTHLSSIFLVSFWEYAEPSDWMNMSKSEFCILKKWQAVLSEAVILWLPAQSKCYLYDLQCNGKKKKKKKKTWKVQSANILWFTHNNNNKKKDTANSKNIGN